VGPEDAGTTATVNAISSTHRYLQTAFANYGSKMMIRRTFVHDNVTEWIRRFFDTNVLECRRYYRYKPSFLNQSCVTGIGEIVLRQYGTIYAGGTS
jgi:hypothetical protein